MSLYKDASLVMIPSAVKDGKLYSIRPTDGSGDFTFSRGSNLAATRVDVNGLIEKGRENLFLQSNQFDTTWSLPNSTLTQGFSGYDGSNNAWKWSSSAAGTTQLSQGTGASGMQTISLYAKAGSRDVFSIWVGTGIDFNLTTGQALGHANASMESVGNGWWRCSYFNIYATLNPYFVSSSAGEFIYIMNAQGEQGLVATDVIETGASTAQAGILEDLPRLDYSGGASCPSLLLEPQRSNLVTQSEYIDAVSWGKSVVGATLNVTSNYGISPDGSKNATRIEASLSGGYADIVRVIGVSSGTAYTYSVYLKSLSGTPTICFLNDGIANRLVTLTTEWERYTFEIPSAGSLAYPRFLLENGVTSSSADYLAWGAQLEAGSYPTSYIPTYGSAVTRSADSASDADISSYYVQNGSTLFFEIECDGEVDESNVTSFLRLGTSINTTRLSFLQGYNRIYSTWYNGNTGAFSNISTLDAGSRVKIAIQIANNGIGRMNGGENAIGNTARDYTLSSENYTRLEIYRSSRFKQLMIFPTLLTASEMEALTTL